jgi:hypothetical protein
LGKDYEQNGFSTRFGGVSVPKMRSVRILGRIWGPDYEQNGFSARFGGVSVPKMRFVRILGRMLARILAGKPGTLEFL